MWNKKNRELPNSRKLKNLLKEVEFLAKSDDYRDNLAILYIIKIYTDYISSSRNIKLLQGETIYSIFDNILLTDDAYKIKIDESFYIELGKFPIITDIWNKDKQIKNLSYIETNTIHWKEDVTNHLMKFILPIGVLLVYNGNHSLNSGVVKSVGYIEVSPNKTNLEIYDISHMYEKVCFNGKYFINIKNNKIISKVQFEYGCIFEIGRILTKYKINLINLYNNQNKK